ncbi:GNAT family N-acetyltransferase [Actinomadura terrae]|uniref:GNAT family N-acetyltransferase n=1 Tax=Actinomadura terrae TaxID=604353 RepID=UPI001FA6BBF3|nr:GNAT family N-acetyltransferase [Actinomadura terrae]
MKRRDGRYRAHSRGGPKRRPVYVQSVRVETKAVFLRQGRRVALRRITAYDQEEFLGLVESSRTLHRPWITLPGTPDEFDDYIGRFDGLSADGFVVCLAKRQSMVGFVNLNEIVRGVYQRGLIGYGAFAPNAGRGYMTEGVDLLLDYAFTELGLHRLEADIQPGNAASLNLVRRLRFQREGFSPAFICIRGKWVDHERWAITREMMDTRPG